jgi:hypothetical protein
MNSKSCCSPVPPPRVIKYLTRTAFSFVALSLLLCPPHALASGDAPQWMHALVNAPLPTYDEKTDAVLLYSETTATVIIYTNSDTHARPDALPILLPAPAHDHWAGESCKPHEPES